MYLNDLENFIILGGLDGIHLDIRTNEVQVYLKLLILLYAGGTIIFSNNKTNFQKALDNFHEYCTIWKLKVSLSKPKVVVFNSRTNRNMTFTLGGTNSIYNRQIQIFRGFILETRKFPYCKKAYS